MDSASAPLFCDTPTLRIAYLCGGPADGRPLMLLHGWPDDATTWDAIVPRLHAAGFRTYRPWLRGCGPTRFRSNDTPRSGETAALAQDALDFADALGLDRFALAGHDWGARTTYFLACTQPHRIVRCAALSLAWQPGLLPTPGLRQAQAFWYQWFMRTERGADTVRREGRAFARMMWDTWSPPGWFDEATFDRVARSFLENPDWAQITVHSYRVRWQEADTDPAYAASSKAALDATHIAVPTLMLQGDDDRVILPETSVGKEPFFTAGYARELVRGVGHFPTREAAREVGVRLATFFGSD